MDIVHFSLEEFVASSAARMRGIGNALPPDLVPEAHATLAMLERIRAYLSEQAGCDVPVHIISGYRCEVLNKVVGGAAGSDHLRACAADIVAPLYGDPASVARALVSVVSVLGIGQLIYERPHGKARAWVHVSSRVPVKAGNRVITITEHETLAGVVL